MNRGGERAMAKVSIGTDRQLPYAQTEAIKRYLRGLGTAYAPEPRVTFAGSDDGAHVHLGWKEGDRTLTVAFDPRGNVDASRADGHRPADPDEPESPKMDLRWLFFGHSAPVPVPGRPVYPCVPDRPEPARSAPGPDPGTVYRTFTDGRVCEVWAKAGPSVYRLLIAHAIADASDFVRQMGGDDGGYEVVHVEPGEMIRPTAEDFC